VLDLNDATQPRRLAHLDSPETASGIRLMGDYAILTGTPAGLDIIDIRNPAAPVLVARHDAPGNPVALDVADGRAYLAGGWTFQILDIASVMNPRPLGTYHTSRSIRDVTVVDSYAFLATAYSGLEVIDVTRPEQPVQIAQLSAGGGAHDLHIVGDRLFLAADEGDVLVYDISNPARPQLVGGVTTLGPARALDVVGGQLFALTHTGLEVFQLSEQPIGFARPPLDQVFTNNGQPLRLEGIAVSVSPLTYQWRKAGVPLTDGPRIDGATGPVLTIHDAAPDDEGEYSLTVSNEHGVVTSPGAFVDYRPGLREALDSPQLSWSPGNIWNDGWHWQSEDTHDGVDAARSRPVQSGIVADWTTVGTHVAGPGRLSFWWRVTVTSDILPHPDVDFSVIVGEEVKASVSEETFRDSDRWERVEVAIPPGEQTLEWVLTALGGCTDPARGTAWLDEVEFTSLRAMITRIAPRTSGGSYLLEYRGPPDTRLTIQSSTDLQTWQDAVSQAEIVPPYGYGTIDLHDTGTQRTFYRLQVLDQ
jgi:hypothetical protein